MVGRIKCLAILFLSLCFVKICKELKGKPAGIVLREKGSLSAIIAVINIPVDVIMNSKLKK